MAHYMKKLKSYLFFLLGCVFTLQAQYSVKSDNILNPDLNIDYVRGNAEFWIKNAYDPQYGGFYSAINRDGSIRNSDQKSLIVQTRHGYSFTRAFMLTGDEKYLDYAQSALDFLYNYGWDNVNEGWYCFAKRDGSIDNRVGWNPNTGKWGFQQQYALLGIIANYEATHSETSKLWMEKGINTLNTKMWDSRAGMEGYYEDANANWTSKSGKGFTSTVDAITTNAELSYLVTQNPAYKSRLMQLANIIVERFIPAMDNSSVKVLYPESYSTNWVPNYSSGGSIGHFLKTAWVLGRAYLCDTTKKEFKNAAKKILDEAWTYRNGDNSVWDHLNGGPFNEININTGVFKTNGDSKDYWTVEQGFTGPMINYYITKDPVYLQMADEALDFFMNHLIDPVYGEIFSQTDPTGLVVRNSTKGDDFKAGYHSTELGYYAYLYSNLYYLHKPAVLYYKFSPSATPQQIKLNPIPYEDDLLQIKSVTLDDQDFTDFNAKTRTLNLAANKGGKFKVTFESVQAGPNLISTTSIVDNVKLYPTQVRDFVTVENILAGSRIRLFDLSSKLIEIYDKAPTNVRIDLQHLKAGIYFVELQAQNGSLITRKIVKM